MTDVVRRFLKKCVFVRVGTVHYSPFPSLPKRGIIC